MSTFFRMDWQNVSNLYCLTCGCMYGKIQPQGRLIKGEAMDCCSQRIDADKIEISYLVYGGRACNKLGVIGHEKGIFTVRDETRAMA